MLISSWTVKRSYLSLKDRWIRAIELLDFWQINVFVLVLLDILIFSREFNFSSFVYSTKRLENGSKQGQ